MKDIFKLEDFKHVEDYLRNNHPSRLSTTEILSIVLYAANSKISRYMNLYPKVYCTKRDSNEHYWTASEKQHEIDTHTAYLVEIEPIKKEQCDHIPKDIAGFENAFYGFGWKTICSKCGVELEVSWKEKK